MRKNMGTIDRGVRFALAVLVAVLYFTGQISGTAAIILGVVAVAFFVTSLVGTCPIYAPFKISTRKKSEA
jgi:Na+(H+)/acetate symporter ActP